MTRFERRLNNAHNKYTDVVKSIENEMRQRGYVEFNFSIMHQPGDGFVLLDEDSNNALFEKCMSIINSKGVLSHDDYLGIAF